jgi:hypothetical protein
MATVFRAEDLKHRRQVAIKVLHLELAATLGGERFLREIGSRESRCGTGSRARVSSRSMRRWRSPPRWRRDWTTRIARA